MNIGINALSGGGMAGQGILGPCVVCEFPITNNPQSPIHTIDYITEISGRPLKDLLHGLFTQDYELLVKLEKRTKRNAGTHTLHVCDICFALLEQIDAFEHNLSKLRLDLTTRRENSSNSGGSGQGCEDTGPSASAGSFPLLSDVGGGMVHDGGADVSLEDVIKSIKQVR